MSHFSEEPLHPTATNPSETNSYARRAARSSEVLRRSLSDPKRLLMSRRSESDKLPRRVSQSARTFFRKMPEGLCALASPPARTLIFHGFSVMRAAPARARVDEIAERQRGDAAASPSLRGICLLDSIYGGWRDPVNRPVNRIRSSCPKGGVCMWRIANGTILPYRYRPARSRDERAETQQCAE